MAPADYWARLKPHLARFGISRLADITGLDRLGFPVVQATRPLARSNVVTQGKASCLEGAAIGAALECLEMAAGETLDRIPDAPKGMAGEWAALAPGADWPDEQTRFIQAWDITGGRLASVPRDLVSTDFAKGSEAEQAPILRHSIGLGAGATLASAMMHGLLECIEADSRIRAAATGGARRVHLLPGHTTYGKLLLMIENAGLRVACHELPSVTGIATIMASVMEEPRASALPLPASGYAARFDPHEALQAAMAEAVQARLAVISGAREDITQRFYAPVEDAALLDAEWARHGPAPGLMFDHARNPASTIQDLACKVGPVYAVPLHWEPDLPLAITRIIAPGLIADPLRLEV